MVKNLMPVQEPQETWFDPSVRKIPWRREWQPTPVFLPGEYHEQRNLAGYGPGGHKELDMTEWLTTATLMLLLGRLSNTPHCHPQPRYRPHSNGMGGRSKRGAGSGCEEGAWRGDQGLEECEMRTAGDRKQGLSSWHRSRHDPAALHLILHVSPASAQASPPLQ